MIRIALISGNDPPEVPDAKSGRGRPAFPDGPYPMTRFRLMLMFYQGFLSLDPFLACVMGCIVCIIEKKRRKKG